VGARKNLRATVWIVLTLGGVSCALTLLYLSMRAVMDVGGVCAEGGPFEIRQHCPEGVPAIMTGSILGGIVLAGMYLWHTVRRGIPGFTLLIWPALFLSLGWNFFEYGIDPPGPQSGLVAGWLVCGGVFALMGGLPLLAVLPSLVRRFTGRGGSSNLSGWLVGVSGAPARRAVVRLARSSRSPSQAPSRSPGIVSELERLDGLHRSGALDDEEFRLAKERLLRGEA